MFTEGIWSDVVSDSIYHSVCIETDKGDFFATKCDTRLMARSKDLLAALERVAATVDGLDMAAELWDDIHAAIAKAKGG